MHYLGYVGILNLSIILIQIQTRRNQCDICGKGFINAAALQTHVERHDNDERNQISDYVSGGYYRNYAMNFPGEIRML